MRTTPALRTALVPLAVAATAALAMLTPSAASAIDCDHGLKDGNDAGWGPDPGDGQFEDAFLARRSAPDAMRGDAFDDYGVAEVDGTEYDNPHPEDKGCELSDNRDTLRFPADEPVAGVKVRPQLHAVDNRALGRQYVTLRNTTGSPVTVDFGWDGDLGSDGGTRVALTSSGDRVVDPTDRWATSCEDDEGNGCRSTINSERGRDPELAHNWERDGGERDSAESITLADGSGDFDVLFEDVTIPAGRKIAYMQVVKLAVDIQGANRAARKTGDGPPHIFGGLSDKERRVLRNW